MAIEPRACEVCEKNYSPVRRDQRFCSSPECKAEGARRRMRSSYATLDGRDLDSVVDEAAERDAARENARRLKQLASEESKRRRYEDLLRELVPEIEPTPLIAPRPAKGLPRINWNPLIGDWHVGQKTRIEETGAMYHQDLETVRLQVMTRLWPAMERIHSIESSGVSVQAIHAVFNGDLIENDDMRASQHRKIDDVLTVQTVQAFDLVAWLIRQWLQLVPKVTVDMVGGNHDRTSRMRGDAGLGELDYVDTMSWLIGAFLERALAPDVESGRLEIRNWETFFGYREVDNLKFVFEHGSSFKWGGGYGGVPWYGISRAGQQYNEMLGGADVVMIGHGHKPAIIPNGRGWIVANGALPATSTYVQAGFKTIQRPLQWLLTSHEDHGITGFKPLYCDLDNQLLPGMVWTDFNHFADLASGKSSPPNG